MKIESVLWLCQVHSELCQYEHPAVTLYLYAVYKRGRTRTIETKLAIKMFLLDMLFSISWQFCNKDDLHLHSLVYENGKTDNSCNITLIWQWKRNEWMSRIGNYIVHRYKKKSVTKMTRSMNSAVCVTAPL